MGRSARDSILTREQLAIVTIRSLGLEKAALALTDAQITATLDPFLDEGAISTDCQALRGPCGRPGSLSAATRDG